MVQRWNVCAIVFWRVVWYRAGTFLLCDHVRARRGAAWPWRGCGRAAACPSCPGCRGVPGHGRRDVAVTSLGVAVAQRGRGCGVRCLCVAVVWLRHADEC